ncbi:MAG: AbrB/MazE/SpoVT family DNA-binding domain-containing protein [Candidatus Dormibacteria bacterium]
MATTITSKGQVTVPKRVRDRMGLRPGDQVDFIEVAGGFHLRKLARQNAFSAQRASLKHLAGSDPDDLLGQLRGD